MIISKEEFNKLTKEELGKLCRQYNEMYGKKFCTTTEKDCSIFWIGSTRPVRFKDEFDAKKHILREDLMTPQEYKQEVIAGHIEGVEVLPDGRLMF